ncbi:hypothetical protein CsSME_00002828 [Camellia sinensis var. sinensis]
MVDDIPHDGASPWIEADPEHVPLPSKVRPFDQETYHPEIVDEARFGLFCMGLSRLIASRPLLSALVERWWDTTNSFHFSVAGDMTMTPYDFAILTDIELWVYAYFPILTPEPEVEMPPVVPYSDYPGRRCLRVSGTSLLVLGVLPVTDLYLRDHGCHATSAIHTGYRECLIPGADRLYMRCTRAHIGRAANAPSTSKVRAPRGRARGVPPIRQSFGWPELPTELTGWQYTGEAYQIPIEPLVASHRYVRALDSPPVPPLPTASAAAIAGPSTPPLAARRERQVPARSRGRARSAQAESGPLEPILSDDDNETSETEEAVGQHTESSESGDDDTGSGSVSGDADAEEGSEAEGDNDSGSGSDSASGSDSSADGDSSTESSPSRKRTKRASRA